MKFRGLISIVFFAATLGSTAISANAFENVHGKTYSPTSKHGPWMIMVASFSDVPNEVKQTGGLTAEQAATELIFDLRARGIPAYSYSQKTRREAIKSLNRRGQQVHGSYISQREMICVLAGNYKSVDEEIGQQTLKFVKQLQPRFLRDSTSGAVLRTDSATRGPLAGAFMTINPMLNPQELVEDSVTNEIAALNRQIAYPLIKNSHLYTLQVATFGGKSAVLTDNDKLVDRDRSFVSNLGGATGFGLDQAGVHAQGLAEFLRTSKRSRQTAGIDEAYVYHDKYQSIVTIGGFDSPNDPRIAAIIEYYSPKMVPSLTARREAESRSLQLLSFEETESLPKEMQPHCEQSFARTWELPTFWAFDTTPKVIRVPRLN